MVITLPAPAVRVFAGGLETCVLTTDAKVYCWEIAGAVTPPAEVPALAFAQSVHPGYALGCGITSDDRPICWGKLQLKTSTIEPHYMPIPGLDKIVDYASGYYHACARTEAGDIVCLGANDAFQLGVATPSESTPPVAPARCTDP